MPNTTEYLRGKHLLCARAKSLQSPEEVYFLQVSSKMSVSVKSGDLSADVSSLMQSRWGSSQWKGAHCEVSLSSASPTVPQMTAPSLPFLRTLSGSSLPQHKLLSLSHQAFSSHFSHHMALPSPCSLVRKPTSLQSCHQDLLSVC